MQTHLLLFDLDGTLVDTAPDLVGAANRQRALRGLEPLPLATLRPFASAGASGLVRAALGLRPEQPEFEAARLEFLSFYAAQIAAQSCLFDGMDAVLNTLEKSGCAWGIVTNKLARYTTPLVRALNLSTRAACIVSGDTAARPKPHPDSIAYALARTGHAAKHTVYVGDDLRDIQAGQAAGTRTIAVRYGYLGADVPIEAWGADHIINHPHELLPLVLEAVDG